jgi:copper(I)-binding protein
MMLRSIFSTIALLTLSASACAHDYTQGTLQIKHPYARATVPGQAAGAAYVTIANGGPTADKLIALSSPAAKRVEMHTMSMDGSMMKMREVDAIAIQPAATIVMQPGDGYHVMLTGLKNPLKIGDKFPLTLTFEKAGQVTVSVWVEAIAAAAHQH